MHIEAMSERQRIPAISSRRVRHEKCKRCMHHNLRAPYEDTLEPMT